MQWPLFVLLVCTACIPTAKPQRATSQQAAPTCFLHQYPKPIGVNMVQAAKALRDFNRQQGAPYTALYIRIAGGQPALRVLRVVQRAPTTFMCYRYQATRTDSLLVTETSWATTFAHFAKGHFASECAGFASEPTEDIVLLKQDTTTRFSLLVDVQLSKN